MKNSLENNEFEEQWKKAFDSKELAPSDRVWSGIDAHLANQEAGGYKRTAVFYRWVAAASIVLLLGWTGYYLTNRYEDSALTDQHSAITQQEINSEIIDNSEIELANKAVAENNGEDDLGNERFNQNEEILLAEQGKTSGTTQSEEINAFTNTNDAQVASIESEEPSSFSKPLENKENTTDARLASIVENKSENQGTTVDGESLIASAGVSSIGDTDHGEALAKTDPNGFDLKLSEQPGLEPEAIPVWDFEIIDKKKNDPESLFAGLNFSPGMFDPNFSNSTAAANNLSALSFDGAVSNSVAESDVNQGFSYGFGVNGGIPVGEKWVLQGGLEYSVGRSETSTSLIVESASGDRSALTFTNSVEAEAMDNSVRISSPTDVTSSYQFISVPIKAGYSILNKKKFGLMVSGGVSSDFFLSNTISSSQQGIASYRQSSGSESPFKSVYFSGLSSLTLTYKVTSNYMILLEPSVKAALNDFSKSSELFNSRPNSFGLGVGIRYRFK